MIKQRPVDHGAEKAAAHPVDNLVKANRRDDLNTQSAQVFRVMIVGVLWEHRFRPRRRTVPAVADDSNPADVLEYRLDCAQDASQASPAEPVVADVNHPELLVVEIERNFPGWVVPMEEKRFYVGAQWMMCRLEDGIGNAVADLDPLTTQLGAGVIDIAYDMDRVIIFSVTVDDHTPRAWHFSEDCCPSQQVPILQFCGELEDEDGGVCGRYLRRVVERRRNARSAEEHDFMPQPPCDPLIVIHILSATTILKDMMNKHQPHQAVAFLIRLRFVSVPAGARHRNVSQSDADEYRTRPEHILRVGASHRQFVRKLPRRHAAPTPSLGPRKLL